MASATKVAVVSVISVVAMMTVEAVGAGSSTEAGAHAPEHHAGAEAAEPTKAATEAHGAQFLFVALDLDAVSVVCFYNCYLMKYFL
jgi:hypothetical protein